MNLFQRFKYLSAWFKREKMRSEKNTLLENVLGNNGDVNALGLFFRQNPDALQAGLAYLLHKYIEDNAFSKEEVDAYKVALGDVGTLFADCLIEMQEKRRLKDNE